MSATFAINTWADLNRGIDVMQRAGRDRNGASAARVGIRPDRDVADRA